MPAALARGMPMVMEIIVFCLAGYLLIVGLVWLVGAGPRLTQRLWTSAASVPRALWDTSQRQSRRDRFEHEIVARIRDGVRGDEQLIDAAEATVQIQVAHRWLQEGTSQCLETHWALAEGLHLTHMSDAAGHPRATALRQRNVELVEFLGGVLAKYPYPTPELVRLEVALPKVGAACAGCPYWFMSRSEAPAICPSARALGYTPNQKNYGAPPAGGPIIDAEPVYDDE